MSIGAIRREISRKNRIMLLNFLNFSDIIELKWIKPMVILNYAAGYKAAE